MGSTCRERLAKRSHLAKQTYPELIILPFNANLAGPVRRGFCALRNGGGVFVGKTGILASH